MQPIILNYAYVSHTVFILIVQPSLIQRRSKHLNFLSLAVYISQSYILHETYFSDKVKTVAYFIAALKRRKSPFNSIDT